MSDNISRYRFRFECTREQLDFAVATEPFPALVAGYGSGKTQALVYRALRLKYQYPSCDVAYYLPTYHLIEDIAYPRFEDVMSRNGVDYTINRQRHRLYIKNCGSIAFRSLDRPEKIVGYEVADSLVDELDTLSLSKASDCWRRIIARNRQKKPDGARNTVAVGTTPEGYRFVWEQWGKDIPNAEQRGYKLYRASTYSNARNLPEHYIQDLEKSYPSALLAAYLRGEFVNLSDAVMQPNWLRRIDSIATGGYMIGMGVDLAISTKESADYTAIVVVAVDKGTGNVYVLHSARAKLTFREVIDWIIRTAQEWRPSIVNIESVQYQASVVQELLRQTHLPIRAVTPERDKQTRFMPLAARYEQGLVYHVGEHHALEEELLAFPVGNHDDMVDSLVYAWQAVGRVGAGGRVYTAGQSKIGALRI